MTNVPILSDAKIKGKRVLLRLDTDIPLYGNKVTDDFRLKVTCPTIEYLLHKGVGQIIILGKLGRPNGYDKRFSLRPVAKRLEKLLEEKITLVKVPKVSKVSEVPKEKIIMLENLRFDKGEEENDSKFVKKLASLGDLYVNESFADSHRKHASIVGVPREFKSKFKFMGFRFAQEIENLSKVLDNPKRPVVFIIGGAKSDKADYIDELLNYGDWVLVGGLLPRIVKSTLRNDGKICVSAAHLLPGGFDIDSASAINFAAITAAAGTIVWNGPLGKYEESKYMHGTEIVARAVGANSDAFRVIGGADTAACLKKIGILDKMNWVSTGGGAMLEFLATGTLPGIEALKK